MCCINYADVDFDNSMSLWFDHHSVADDQVHGRPVEIGLVACETCPVAVVVPPAALFQHGTVGARPHIIILVVRGESHAVVVKTSSIWIISVPVAFVQQSVAGVSAVSRHFQSIFVVQLVTDLERPVLGREPEIR